MAISFAPSSPVEVAPAQSTTQSIPMIGGVPMVMVDYFNLDYRNLTPTDKKQINDIYAHFAEGGRPIEEITAMIRGVEQKKGMSSNDSRHSRVWRYVKISNQINELLAQRQYV